MNLTPDFEFKSIIKGKVINIVPAPSDKPASLQFFGQIEGDEGVKLQIIDVKVKGATKSDLEQFLNKEVEIDDVKVFSGDYGAKFYRVEDLSLVSLIGVNSKSS